MKRKTDKTDRNTLGTGRFATLAVDLLIAAADNCSNVFARWRQCARPPNTRFFAPSPIITPNGNSIGSAVFA